ncbi:MAG: hypothetical protein MZV70_56905 [Desulfobacterales bacterium]|nr:hypothetical protein [Desulfobacterales bacterium]
MTAGAKTGLLARRPGRGGERLHRPRLRGPAWSGARLSPFWAAWARAWSPPAWCRWWRSPSATRRTSRCWSSPTWTARSSASS